MAHSTRTYSCRYLLHEVTRGIAPPPPPPNPNGMPAVHCRLPLPIAFFQASLEVYRDPFTLLGGERHWKSIKRRALPSALSPEELPIPLDRMPVHRRLPLLTLLTGFSGSSRYTPGWREALGRVSTVVPHPHPASFCKFLS